MQFENISILLNEMATLQMGHQILLLRWQVAVNKWNISPQVLRYGVSWITACLHGYEICEARTVLSIPEPDPIGHKTSTSSRHESHLANPHQVLHGTMIQEKSISTILGTWRQSREERQPGVEKPCSFHLQAQSHLKDHPTPTPRKHHHHWLMNHAYYLMDQPKRPLSRLRATKPLTGGHP
jgi:hypothetical protein